MTLQVIGAGFGRTSTNSLKVALERLGYAPCHHMKEVMPRRDQVDLFNRAGAGEAVEWSVIFEGFQAACDWPSAKFHKELAAHYPDAKIVLSVRDADKWYDRTRSTIFAFTQSMPRWLRWLSPRMRTIHQMVTGVVWDGVFGGRFADEAYAKQVFLQNTEDVKAYYPPERLLVHHPADGWQPLCEFLGKDMPAEPYPRVNEAHEIERIVKIFKALSYLPYILMGLIIMLWVF